MQEQTNGAAGATRRPWGAFNIIQREGLEKPIWNRVGTAFFNRDGSINVFLDSFPMTGKIQLREDREREQARKGALARAAEGEDA